MTQDEPAPTRTKANTARLDSVWNYTAGVPLHVPHLEGLLDTGLKLWSNSIIQLAHGTARLEGDDGRNTCSGQTHVVGQHHPHQSCAIISTHENREALWPKHYRWDS